MTAKMPTAAQITRSKAMNPVVTDAQPPTPNPRSSNTQLLTVGRRSGFRMIQCVRSET